MKDKGFQERGGDVVGRGAAVDVCVARLLKKRRRCLPDGDEWGEDILDAVSTTR